MSALGNKDVRRVGVARQHLHNGKECGEDPGLRRGERTGVSLRVTNFRSGRPRAFLPHLLLQILCILGLKRGLPGTCQLRGEPLLQLGRAQVLISDKEAARKSYSDFLTLWKTPIPMPIYKQAKAEYATLR